MDSPSSTSASPSPLSTTVSCDSLTLLVLITLINVFIITVASTYDFTDAGADDYTFVPHNRFQIVKDDGSIEDLVADFEETTAKVEGVLAVERRAIEKRAEFPGCTAARSSLITTAYGVAATYATNAKDYLAANTGATQRYTTWFGAANASRRSTVVSHFQKISAGNFASYTYDCSCTRSGVYAYVYSNQPGKMWLCREFLPSLIA